MNLDRSIVVSADEAERTGLRHDQVQVSEEYVFPKIELIQDKIDSCIDKIRRRVPGKC